MNSVAAAASAAARTSASVASGRPKRIFQGVGGEDNRVLRHQADARANPPGSA